MHGDSKEPRDALGWIGNADAVEMGWGMSMGLWVIADAWPDGADLVGIAAFLAAVVLLPIAGYWLTILDIRAYLRALRGALVRIASPVYSTPSWLDKETPPCLRALGLEWPCSEEDVKVAYHRLAKELHPDHGGDIRRFLQLQQQLEQANHYIRQRRARK